MKIYLPDKKIIDKKLKQIEIPDINIPKVKVSIPVPEQYIPERYRTSAFNNIAMVLSFVLLIAGFFAGNGGWLDIVLFAASVLLSGREAVLSLIDSFSQKRFFCEEAVCILAVIADAAVSNFQGAASIMLGFRVLRLVERLIDDKVDGIVDELDIPIPKKATVETEYGLKKIPVRKIEKGRIIIVDKKEVIPVDGLVVEGKSTLELYPLTGISETVAVVEGDRVSSGCINLSGSLVIKAACNAAQSEAVLLSNFIFSACTLSTPKERMIKRWGQIFFAVFAVLGLLTCVAIPLAVCGSWYEWISRGALVAALSCSFILIQSLTAVLISGIAVCTSHGIIVKNSSVLEKIAQTTTFIFNKTGTLTEKKFTVEEVFPENMSGYELLSISAAAEQFSRHPIARAICNACPDYERFAKNQISIEEIPCRGISTSIKGRHIFVGNAGLLEEHGIRCKMARLGTTAAHVAVNGKYCGYIVLSNKVKEKAFDAVEALRAQKINNLVMLTGDLHTVSRRVASSLNMDMVKAELTREDKRSVVEYLTENNDSGNNTAYVCCGCEDEALFAAADVGVSVGALGNKAAEKHSDAVILKDDLEQLSEFVSTASETMRKCTVNVIAFFAFKLLVILFAMSSALSELPLVAADAAAAFLIMLNSFTMLRNRKE